MTSKETLKNWFSNLKKPTQTHFWAWLDSYFHKEEKIPMSQIEGLDKALQNTASSSEIKNHLTDNQAHNELFDLKVDKVEGKGLSSEDFTSELKEKLEGLRNVDVSHLLEKGSYTGTAQDLKTAIDGILTIFNSPDTELDTLQEIVAYIKQNKQILSQLSVENIAGLIEILAQKAEKNHSHRWEEITEKPDFSSLLSALPYREITIQVPESKVFTLPKLGNYEYPDKVQIISATPIHLVSEHISLEGIGEKTLVVPRYVRYSDGQTRENSSGLEHHKIQLSTESSSVKVLYFIGNLEKYLNVFGAKSYFFGRPDVKGNFVSNLPSNVKHNTPAFTTFVDSRIPEIYEHISDVSGLQDKGFLSYIPEPFAQKHDYLSQKVGMRGVFIYTDLSGQQFTLQNNYYSLQENSYGIENNIINYAGRYRWERYTLQEPKKQEITSEKKFEILTDSVQLSEENAGTHFMCQVQNNQLYLSLPYSNTENLYWKVSLTEYFQPFYGGGFGSGYMPPPNPISLNISGNQVFLGFSSDKLFQNDTLTIFTKNGSFYIVKD